MHIHSTYSMIIVSADWLKGAVDEVFHKPNAPLIKNDGRIKQENCTGENFSSSNYLLAQSSLLQCEQHSPTDPGELIANVDQMYRVTD